MGKTQGDASTEHLATARWFGWALLGISAQSLAASGPDTTEASARARQPSAASPSAAALCASVLLSSCKPGSPVPVAMASSDRCLPH